MTNEFVQEERYIVFKISDTKEALSASEIDDLKYLHRVTNACRERLGKKPLECVVIESHWPEYEATWKAIEARVTGAQAQPAPSKDEEFVGWYCAHCQRGVDASEVTYHEQHEACGRVITNDRPPKPTPNFEDAYQGAMEEVAIWKKRALEAEELNRKFVAEINGHTHMGEPVQPAPNVPDDVIEQAVNRFLSWKLPKDFHPDGGMVFIPTKGRGYDSPYWPIGTNLFTAEQAREMLRYALAAAAPEAKP